MNLAAYQRQKADRARAETAMLALKRSPCRACRKEPSTCICARVRAFEAGFELVVLLHPKEAKKRVGTGRLTHLCVSNSRLFEGVDFTRDTRVNAILEDAANFCVTLFPGPAALDLTADAEEAFERLVPEGRRLVIFLLDGSWSCAKTMLRLSRNLAALPRVAFTPPAPSNYRIRRQPAELCFASVEATHWLVANLAQSRRWSTAGDYANLLEVFESLVERQLSHVSQPNQRAARGTRQRHPQTAGR